MKLQKSRRNDGPIDKAIRKFRYGPVAELVIRDALESWIRTRWPESRIVHELVVGGGAGRADMAAVSEHHFAAFQIEDPDDDVSRLLHQCGVFRLAVPELWLITDARRKRHADLIRYLLPTIGVALVEGLPDSHWEEDGASDGDLRIVVQHEPKLFALHGKSLLSVLWLEELKTVATAYHIRHTRVSTHAGLVRNLDTALSSEEKLAAVCGQLRRRAFVFRSDAPK